MAGNSATAQVTVEVQNQTEEPDVDVELEPRDGKRVRGKFEIELEADDAYELEIQVDGQTIARAYDDELEIKYDSTRRMDGPMEIKGIVHTAYGTVTKVHHVTVDNIKVRGLYPSRLGLWSCSKKGWVWIKLKSKRGMPHMSADNKIELRPRGGASIEALKVYSDRRGRNTWVVFDRNELIASIRGAMATGGIEEDARKIKLDCYIDGHAVGTAKVKLYKKKRRGHGHR